MKKLSNINHKILGELGSSTTLRSWVLIYQLITNIFHSKKISQNTLDEQKVIIKLANFLDLASNKEKKLT